MASEMDLKLVPYELAEGMEQTKQLIESVKPGQRIGYFHRSGGRLRGSGGDTAFCHRGRNTADYAGQEDPSYGDRRIYD